MRHLFFAAILLLPATASAGVLFSEDFQSGLPSGNWAVNSFGQVVSDPTGGTNQVLSFSALKGGGDLFSQSFSTASTYYLEFDYYYSSDAGSSGGGFVGVNSPGETWLLGDCGGCYATYSNALDGLTADAWHHIQLSFTASDVGPGPIQLKLEQFTGLPGTAYFDNIAIRDDGFADVTTPEPSTGVLFAIGAGVAALVRSRRAKRA